MKSVRQLTIIVCLFFLQSILVAQTTYTVVTSNGDWSNASTWSPAGVPGPGDHAVIVDKNVKIISEQHTIAGFTLGNGTIFFDGINNPTLTITDTAVWYDGEFDGGNGAGGGDDVNSTFIINSGATLIMDADSTPQSHRFYEGIKVINQGTIRHIGSTATGARGLSVLRNEGLYEMVSDADFDGESFSGGIFINTSTGVLRKSGGTDITSFNTWWNFQNQGGTIDAQSGSIHFTGTGTFDGANFIAADNAAIDFRSSTLLFKGTFSGSPAGAVRLSGSTINIDSSGVTFDFQGSGFQWSMGSLKWGGTLTIAEGSLLRLVPDPVNPTPFLSLTNGTTIINLGTIRQESNTTFSASGIVVIDNRSLFEVVTDADFSGGSGGGTLLNSGIFRKADGNEIISFNIWWKFLNEEGTIEANSGSIHFNCNGIFNGGNYYAAENASIDFVTLAQTIKGTLSGSPAGMVRFAGSTITVDSSGAILDFQGSGIQWSAGGVKINTTLTIAENSLLRLFTDTLRAVNARNQGLSGGGTLLNLGVIRQESNDVNGLVGGNSIVDNQSLFEITTDADFPGPSGGGNGTFLNNGILRKSGGTGTTLIASRWAFNNESGGVIEANSGIVEFQNGFTNKTLAENSVIKGNAAINVASITNNGVVSPGTSVGILSYIGNYNPSTEGVLNIEISGLEAGSGHDQLNVTGNANLDGTLKLYTINGFVPAVGDSFIVLAALGAVNDSFMTIEAQQGLHVTVKINSNNVTVVIDSVGNLVSVDEDPDAVVTDYNLLQNYPNPFNPSTAIKFSIPQTSYVTLEIFNSLGERVDLLLKEELNTGRHTINWNAAGLTSGIYFYRITAGNFIETKKMMLLK